MATRDNGLVAARYVELTELDPRVADTMLAVLRAAGIAAYAEASRGRSGPYVETVLPPRPLDRLWVDGERLEQARVLVREQTSGPRDTAAVPDLSAVVTPPATAPESEADAWARIVAMFDDVTTDPVPRWPASEDVESPPPGDDVASRRRILRRGEAPGWALQSTDSGGYDDDPVAIDEDDDHYVPPPPPPLPKPQLATKRALSSIAAGIALIFAPKIWPNDVPEAAMFIGVVAILGGVVALVMGMREGRSGTGPDDGAVV